MKKIICCPESLVPETIKSGDQYFSLYSSITPKREGIGHIAINLKREIRKAGFTPSVRAWDFTSIALSVAAADMSCKRSQSADGWTRQIELDICLCEPLVWFGQKKLLESTLRFLTGDFWTLNFFPNGEAPPQPRKSKVKTYDANCVSLVSGGVDSLVGAIDLTRKGEAPLFVSKTVLGDKSFQSEIAMKLGAQDRHLQWSYPKPKGFPKDSEASTRGRSVIFFAYAVLAASTLESNLDGPVDIYVPENGFISLNVPLNPGRMGTLSTKTTHPVYLNGLQKIWDAVNINAKLRFPHEYQFKTKGELLEGCLDKTLLAELIPHSTSCGRFGTYKRTHCGRCVPCMVRRAAFIKAGLPDTTDIASTTGKQYVFDDLSVSGLQKGANDIGALATAYLRYRKYGINRYIGGSLAFSPKDERSKYEGVVKRGLDEVGQLLINHGVI